MTTKTIIALSIGTLAMLILIVIMMKWYKVRLWKGIPVAIILTIIGTISTYIWFFVEASWFGGRSYYGAVFFVPPAFAFIAKWMRIPHKEVLDFCAPAECVMLAIMKYQCLVDGCCSGIFLYMTAEGKEVYFPSQIVELINALVLVILLMYLARYSKNRGKVYAWYLVLYGTTRFVLNWFRAANTPMLMGLPEGNVWSLIAVIWGVLWLKNYRLVLLKQEEKNEKANCEIINEEETLLEQ